MERDGQDTEMTLTIDLAANRNFDAGLKTLRKEDATYDPATKTWTVETSAKMLSWWQHRFAAVTVEE